MVYYHLDHVASKLTKSNGLLAKLRHFVPSAKYKMLYNALIQPHLDYGSLSWSSAANSSLSYIEKIQNKSIRLLTFKMKTDSAQPLYKDMEILPLKQNIILNQTKFIWKFTKNQLPNSIQMLFIQHRIQVGIRSTDDNKLTLPSQRTNYGTSFLFYSGVKSWNTILNQGARIASAIRSFRIVTKKLLLSTI